jgi:hypothetical protein
MDDWGCCPESFAMPATIRHSRIQFEMWRELFEGGFPPNDSDLGDGLGWVALNQRHRWHRDRVTTLLAGEHAQNGFWRRSSGSVDLPAGRSTFCGSSSEDDRLEVDDSGKRRHIVGAHQE